MDNWPFLIDSIERQRYDTPMRGFLLNAKPTATERYSLKSLLKAVEIRLSEVEDRLRVLEKSQNIHVAASGPQENNIASSFEALLFWFKLLEKKVTAYSDKIPIETEFGPRVKIISRKIKILIKRESNSLNNHEK